MLAGVGTNVHHAFYNPGPVENVRLIRNDLMCAADSVTSAMSSLVKEFNSGGWIITAGGNQSDYFKHTVKIFNSMYMLDIWLTNKIDLV